MVCVNVGQERLQLNEETVYSGGPNRNITEESGAGIDQVRKLLFKEKFVEAQAMAIFLFREEASPQVERLITEASTGALYSWCRLWFLY